MKVHFFCRFHSFELQYFLLCLFSSLFADAFSGGLNVFQQIVYEKSIYSNPCCSLLKYLESIISWFGMDLQYYSS